MRTVRKYGRKREGVSFTEYASMEAIILRLRIISQCISQVHLTVLILFAEVCVESFAITNKLILALETYLKPKPTAHIRGSLLDIRPTLSPRC